MRNIIKLALAGLLSVSTFAVAAESSPEALRMRLSERQYWYGAGKKATSYWKNAIRNQKISGWSSPRVRKCWKR